MEHTLPKPFVFVLMPFDQSFNDLYRFGIKGAADDVGAYAERVDEQIFSEGMLDRIFNQISKADVIVADMTGRNANVFYEVGYAHALGKTVILLTRNVDDIPFDLKHRQHTVYEDIDSLRKQLSHKLVWAIAEARRRKNHTMQDRLILSVGERILPELPSNAEWPIATAASAWSQLPTVSIALRNGGVEAIPTITHIYLLARRGAQIVPTELQERSQPLSFTSRRMSGGAVERSYKAHFEIRPIESGGEDFSLSYRLRTTITPLPPEAVEEIPLDLRLSEGASEAVEDFILRLHSAGGVHDFGLRVHAIREAQPEPPPVARRAIKLDDK